MVGFNDLAFVVLTSKQLVSFVGVGINLNQRFDRWNADKLAQVANMATSVAQELNVDHVESREQLLADVLAQIDEIMQTSSFEAVLSEYNDMHALRNARVRVHHKSREESDERDYDADVVTVAPSGLLAVRRVGAVSTEAPIELSGEEVSVRPKM